MGCWERIRSRKVEIRKQMRRIFSIVGHRKESERELWVMRMKEKGILGIFNILTKKKTSLQKRVCAH